MDCGICRILELRFNGEKVPPNVPKVLAVNGKRIRSRGEQGDNYLTVVYPTPDPNIDIDISRLQPGEVNILYIRMEYRLLPLSMAEDLAGAVRKWV